MQHLQLSSLEQQALEVVRGEGGLDFWVQLVRLFQEADEALQKLLFEPVPDLQLQLASQLRRHEQDY